MVGSWFMGSIPSLISGDKQCCTTSYNEEEKLGLDYSHGKKYGAVGIRNMLRAGFKQVERIDMEG